jgi:uncharacterized protein (UPF0147 family)
MYSTHPKAVSETKLLDHLEHFNKFLINLAHDTDRNEEVLEYLEEIDNIVTSAPNQRKGYERANKYVKNRYDDPSLWLASAINITEIVVNRINMINSDGIVFDKSHLTKIARNSTEPDAKRQYKAQVNEAWANYVFKHNLDINLFVTASKYGIYE